MQTERNILYTQKVIRSGQMLEIYTYAVKQVKSLETNPRDIKGDAVTIISEEEKAERTEEYRRQSKKKFRRLIEANSNIHHEKDKFMTLTYAENMEDRQQALKDFRNFLKKARRKYGKFEYISVIEYQKRGAVHFHCFLFGFPFVPINDLPELTEVWGHGFLELKVVRNHFKLQNYLTKYFMKTFQEERSRNERRYFASKGLKRSQVFIFEKEIDFNEVGYALFDLDFDSYFVGQANYKKIRLYDNNAKKKMNELISSAGASTEAERR